MLGHMWRKSRNIPPLCCCPAPSAKLQRWTRCAWAVPDYLLKDDIQRLPHVIAAPWKFMRPGDAREQAVAQLAASQRRLADLAEHLQTSIEQERASIAREIHDDIGGALTAVRFDVAWIGRHSTDPAMQEHASISGRHAATRHWRQPAHHDEFAPARFLNKGWSPRSNGWPPV